MSKILDFYRNNGKTDSGLTLEKVWSMSHPELEITHDYIQWLFPLNEPSTVLMNAPVLTDDDMQEFKKDKELQHSVIMSFHKMLNFYGLELRADHIDYFVARSENFEERASEWFTPRNHNLLRLTRIMRSLVLMGLEEYAAFLLDALLGIVRDKPGIVSLITIMYWEESLNGTE